MKEFIEKLISRLEEEKEKYKQARANTHCVITETSECDSCRADHYLYARLNCVDKSIEIVNQLAEEYINCSTDTSTNTSSGWIPTSERLPEKNAIVLTCDKDGWISVKVNMPYAGVKNDFECGYYIAWMPLPDPYRPKGENDDNSTNG